MKQSRFMSLVEAVTNVVVGFGVAVTAQVLVFPVFGIRLPLGTNVQIAVVFTLISIVRSFVLRRIFEAIRIRQQRRQMWQGRGR